MGQGRAREAAGEKSVLSWFRRLVPQAGDFFSKFERHSAATVVAADALLKLTTGDGDRHILLAKIREQEHAADEVIREVLTEVRQTFLTPFDRGAIIDLIVALDDTIDEIWGFASAVELYDKSDFEPDMRVMAEKIVGAVALIDECMPLMRDVVANGPKLHELTARIVATEGEVDIVHIRGLKANYARARQDGDTLQFIVTRETYKHLERIADAFEDVANQIDGIVVDHA
jgi:predicted phosphate transport protein (TIGR00153 family)